jgi:hypothetical protein
VRRAWRAFRYAIAHVAALLCALVFSMKCFFIVAFLKCEIAMAYSGRLKAPGAFTPQRL